VLIGEWAKGTMGANAASAKIAFLDLATNQPTVDYLRDQGFMQGFGIDVKDPNKYGDETDPRICGHEVTGGAEDGGRTALETLLQKCPDVNLVYSINEPAAAGGYQALKAAGKDDGSVLTVAIDGSCDGVKNVAAGTLGATSMQFPLKMAVDAVDTIENYVKTGKKPTMPASGFVDTGATLITDKPVTGVPSVTSAEGLKLCWG